MPQLRSLLALSLSFFFAAALAAAQEMHLPARSTPAFDQLKSLAGEWEGKETSSGMVVKLSYKVVSNGSAVMETMRPANEPEMITMYTLEGDRIVVTHYCSAGNQPTMQTAPLSGATGKYDFTFVRVAGTKSPDEGHMAGLSVSIPDKDHLVEVWTFQNQGQSHAATFTYTRAK